MPPKRGRGGVRTTNKRDSTRRESLSRYFDTHSSSNSCLATSPAQNNLSTLLSSHTFLPRAETRERNRQHNRREERERERPSTLRYQSRVDNSMLHRTSTLVHINSNNTNTNNNATSYHRSISNNRSNHNYLTYPHSPPVTGNHGRVSSTVPSTEMHDENDSTSSVDVKTGNTLSDTLQAVRAQILSELSVNGKNDQHSRLVCKKEQVVKNKSANDKERVRRQRNSVPSSDDSETSDDDDDERSVNKCEEHHIRALRIAFGDNFASMYEQKIQRNCASNDVNNNNEFEAKDTMLNSKHGKTKGDKTPCKKSNLSRLLQASSSLSSSFSSSSSSSTSSTTNDSPSCSQKKPSSRLSQRLLEENEELESKLEEDELQELCVSSVEFSLICPYSRLPMTYPVRSRQCNHVQCCDLDSWIALLDKYRALRDPKGPCPVCEQRVSASSLEIDQWMLSIIAQMPPSTHLVVLHNDGTVESADIARERKKQAMMMYVIDATQNVCNDDDDDNISNDDDDSDVINIMDEEEEELEFQRREANKDLQTITANNSEIALSNSEDNVGISKENVNEVNYGNFTVPFLQTSEHATCTDSTNASTLDTMQSAKSTCTTLEHSHSEEVKNTDLTYTSNVKKELCDASNNNRCEINVEIKHVSTQEEYMVLGHDNVVHDKQTQVQVAQECMTPSGWLPPVVIVRYEESHSTRVLPSQLRKWVPHCPQCKVRLKKDEFDCWCGCVLCNKLHVDEWTYVRKFRPIANADHIPSASLTHNVMMEITADGTTILRNVDQAAAYLFRAGFQRCDGHQCQLEHWPPSVWFNSSASSVEHNNSIWVSTYAFSRVELDFLEACCERVASFAHELDFDGNAVPPLFRIPHRRKAARRDANTIIYSCNNNDASANANDVYTKRRKENNTQSSHTSELSLPSSVPSSQTYYHSYAPTFTSSAVLCASNGLSPAVELTFPCESESVLPLNENNKTSV